VCLTKISGIGAGTNDRSQFNKVLISPAKSASDFSWNNKEVMTHIGGAENELL